MNRHLGVRQRKAHRSETQKKLHRTETVGTRRTSHRRRRRRRRLKGEDREIVRIKSGGGGRGVF